MVGLLGGLVGSAVIGCSGIERTDPKPRAARLDRSFQIQVPQIMRGTVASETVLLGYEQVFAHGYGLVVGLNGTGSSDVPPDVRAQMIATASRHGIGSERSGWGDLSPEALVDSPNTAVVVVQAVIPPASPQGIRFDVQVYAHPTSSTTSLEGGRLYTAELLPMSRPGGGFQLMPPTGSRQPAPLARASGPIFINPFAGPDDTKRDTIDRRSGRILNGGVVERDMPLKLRLASPSHALASTLQRSINTRFPLERTQRDPTARGESDEAIKITVPPSYRDRTQEFIGLLRHTTIRQGGTEGVARTIQRHVIENPSTARAASWRWQALGPRALSTVRDLYSYPEELPRLAALSAGANLKDPLVAPHLITMAESDSVNSRLQAIKLLGEMGVDPLIDRALRDLLNDDDVEARLAAYEALVNRRDPSVKRLPVDGKFVLDVVESNKPMVYIPRAGLPRLALFGVDLSVDRPVTVSTWSNRFMIKGDLEQEMIEVYYRGPDASLGTPYQVNPEIAQLVQFLGHTTTVEQPTTGLGFSYGQVVGVLHQIWRQGYLKADFKAEQDRILAALIRRQREGAVMERPEFSQDDTERGNPDGAPDEKPQAASMDESDRPTPSTGSGDGEPQAPR